MQNQKIAAFGSSYRGMRSLWERACSRRPKASISAFHSRRLMLLGPLAQQIKHCRVRRPFDIPPGPALGAQVAVGPDHPALADGMAGHAAHGLAFEDVEVDLLVMGLGRNRPRALR